MKRKIPPIEHAYLNITTGKTSLGFAQDLWISGELSECIERINWAIEDAQRAKAQITAYIRPQKKTKWKGVK